MNIHCATVDLLRATNQDTRRESATKKLTATVYVEEAGSERTTADQGETSISSMSTTQTNQDVNVESKTTTAVVNTSLSGETVSESMETANGIKSNISTTYSTLTTKENDFNSDDVMELQIIVLVCGCIFLVLLVYTCVVCVYIGRRNKYEGKSSIKLFWASCFCLCCTHARNYLYLGKSGRLERQLRAYELEIIRRWQEDQRRSIPKSINGDEFDIKILEKEEVASLDISRRWQEDQGRNIPKSIKVDAIDIKIPEKEDVTNFEITRRWHEDQGRIIPISIKGDAIDIKIPEKEEVANLEITRRWQEDKGRNIPKSIKGDAIDIKIPEKEEVANFEITRRWQEDQGRNIPISVKGDAIDIKISEKEEVDSSLCSKDIVKRNEHEVVIGAIKERVIPGDDFPICVVQPLKTGKNTSDVPVPNKPFEEHDERSLDWEAIILFLMKLIQPAEWKLFGTHLLVLLNYPSNKQEVDMIAAETSNNVNECILNLFHKWHFKKGRGANRRGEIEDAMAKLGWNLQLDDFRNFMKNPPLIQDQNVHKQLIELTEYTGEENLYKSLLSNYRSSGRKLAVCAARDLEQCSLENIKVLREDDTRNIICHSSCIKSTGYREVNESAYTNMENPLEVGKSSAITIGNVKWQKKRKRKLQFADDACAEAQKKRKQSKRSSMRHKHFPDRRKSKKQNGKSNICAKLANWDDISKSRIINLIKIVLPLENQYLQEKEYNLFLDSTVSCILEQTGKPEEMILSIRIDDYRDVQNVKTKSRENYVIDTHTTSLLLDKEGWEQLQLYKLHAREKVLHKIRQDTGSQLDSIYLFISYEGQPLIEQVNNDSDREQIEESKTADYTEASFNKCGQASGGNSMLGEPTRSRYNSSIEQVRLNGYSDHKGEEKCNAENIKVTNLNEKDPISSGHNKAKEEPECKSTSKWKVFVLTGMGK